MLHLLILHFEIKRCTQHIVELRQVTLHMASTHQMQQIHSKRLDLQLTICWRIRGNKIVTHPMQPGDWQAKMLKSSKVRLQSSKKCPCVPHMTDASPNSPFLEYFKKRQHIRPAQGTTIWSNSAEKWQTRFVDELRHVHVAHHLCTVSIDYTWVSVHECFRQETTLRVGRRAPPLKKVAWVRLPEYSLKKLCTCGVQSMYTRIRIRA